MPRIVIVGSGIAGCAALRHLRKCGCSAAITVVSMRRELFYSPGIPGVLAGARNPTDLSFDLTHFFTRHNADFRLGKVTGLDLQTATLITSDGRLEYDYLVIASGAHYPRRIRGQESTLDIADKLDDLLSLSHYLETSESGSLAFGVELAGSANSGLPDSPWMQYLFGIDRLLRREGRRDRFRLNLFGPAVHPDPVSQLQLSERDIYFYPSVEIHSFDRAGVNMALEHIPGERVVYRSRPEGSGWLRGSHLQLDNKGFVECDKRGLSLSHDNIYVVGTASARTGASSMPGYRDSLRQVERQARLTAGCLMAQLQGRPCSQPEPGEPGLELSRESGWVAIFEKWIASVSYPVLSGDTVSRFIEWQYLRHYRKSV